VRGAVLAALVTFGCSNQPSPGRAPAAGLDTVGQLCAYDLAEPAQLTGSLPSYAGRGVDCVPPEGGPTFTLGFGWPGGVLHLVAPRPAAGVVPLSSIGLYLRTPDGWCVEWAGVAIIDDSADWSVALDGVCVSGDDDDGLRVVGQLASH
jgi:hypothetical protein